jgi:hypothetical protein
MLVHLSSPVDMSHTKRENQLETEIDQPRTGSLSCKKYQRWMCDRLDNLLGFDNGGRYKKKKKVRRARIFFFVAGVKEEEKKIRKTGERKKKEKEGTHFCIVCQPGRSNCSQHS